MKWWDVLVRAQGEGSPKLTLLTVSKRQQLGEADVSAPQFNRFFYCQEDRNPCQAHPRLGG
jgi:hypothetical protein